MRGFKFQGVEKERSVVSSDLVLFLSFVLFFLFREGKQQKGDFKLSSQAKVNWGLAQHHK